MIARLRRVLTGWAAPDPAPEYSALDRADGLPYRRPVRPGAGPTPLFDQTAYATGTIPERGAADVDALAAELDLLALPILTGTLTGHNGRVL